MRLCGCAISTSRASRVCHRPTLAMRAVVQRVASANVQVDGQTVASIGPGLLCLVGIKAGDSDKDVEFICRKMLNCRLFPTQDGTKAWDQNVTQMQYEVLVVSQFTLYGFLKGNKPDFHLAMPPQQAEGVYQQLLQRLRREYVSERVFDGVFGAMMQVSLVNDGPVTLQLDSENPGGK